MRKLIADDEDLEPVGDTKTGEKHLRIQAGRVGNRDHRNMCAVRAHQQVHQARQRLNARQRACERSVPFLP